MPSASQPPPSTDPWPNAIDARSPLTQLVRVVQQLVLVAFLALVGGAALLLVLAIHRRRSGRGLAEAYRTATIDVSLLLTAAAIAVLTLPLGVEDHRVVALVPFQDIAKVVRQTSFSYKQVWDVVGLGRR